ncbi:zinc finger, CCHC-type containing protein, partial [Tanacetum coccineum]
KREKEDALLALQQERGVCADYSYPKDGGDDVTVKQIRKRAKWDNDDFVCRGITINDMSDSLFDIYQNIESSKEHWDFLEAKYTAEDASSKKFLVSNFINYKMTDLRPVMEQYNELLDFKHTLKYLKEELTLVELGNHLRIEESLRAQDSDKPKGNNVAGPQLNIVNDNIGSAFMSTFKLNDSIIWHARLGHVLFKRMQDMSKDGLILTFDMDTEKCKTCMLNKITKKPFQNVKRETEVLELIHRLSQGFWGEAMAVVRLPDPKLKTLGERGIECDADPPLDFWWNALSSRGLVCLLILWSEEEKNTLRRNTADVVSHSPGLLEVLNAAKIHQHLDRAPEKTGVYIEDTGGLKSYTSGSLASKLVVVLIADIHGTFLAVLSSPGIP